MRGHPYSHGEIAELRAQSLDELATAHEERARALAREDLDRETHLIAEALQQQGPLERDERQRIVGGRDC